MKIRDLVYGIEEIKEPILIELIKSKPLQRLKGISQFGFPDKYYHKKTFSRYEHSMGVFILVKKMDGNLEEQVSALLHDVSHTSFSHVIDWVLGDPTKENYQDLIHLEIIKNSEISPILKKYGMDYKNISNIKNFSLLERNALGLCADRIDYSIREMFYNGKKNLVRKIVLDLKNMDNQIVFTNKNLAEVFAREYMILQKEHWAGNEARARYYILANILKKALNKQIIFKEDFMKTDEEVIKKLYFSKDNEILTGLNSLKKDLKLENSENGIELKKKFRSIDPEIFLESKLVNLSEVSQKYKKFIEFEKKISNSLARVLIK